MMPRWLHMQYMMMQKLRPTTLLKGAEDTAQNVSDDTKIGVHKAVSDAKIAAHEAGSELKKK